MADGVVGEAAEIGAEGLLRALLRLGANLLAVTEPAVKIRQRPARVGQADLERREPVEHATEDQMRRGDGGVEWIAEEIAQVEGREPLGADHAERMEQHGQTERGGALEDREEGRIGELPPADIGAHVDAADAGQSRGAIELGERPHLVLHRQHGAAHEAVGVGHVRRARGVVEGSGETSTGRAVRPVHHRNGEREGLNAHALAVHRADAQVQVPVARLERWGARGAEDDDGAPGVRAIHAGAERRAGFLDQPDEALRKEVRVDVDAEGSSHGSGFYSECTGDGSLKAGGTAGRLPPSREPSPSRRTP